MAWNQTAKRAYLDKCGTDEQLDKNRDIFTVIFSFGCIVATLIALPLLLDSKARIGLYVILTVLCVGSVLLSLCKFIVKYSITYTIGREIN